MSTISVCTISYPYIDIACTVNTNGQQISTLIYFILFYFISRNIYSYLENKKTIKDDCKPFQALLPQLWRFHPSAQMQHPSSSLEH
jgi:hypothetical protein